MIGGIELEAKVDVSDAAVWQILDKSDELEQIATGFGFTEGPVWCGNHLLFSDIPRNRITRLRLLAEGPEITTYRHPSGNSNGLTLDRSGRLIACEHSARRVSLTEMDGTIKPLATQYQGKRLNSPNDVVVRSDGSIYFTDPPYGLRDHSAWKELPFNGGYRISPDDQRELLVDDFERPNGLVFSPDETKLYVDDTERNHIRSFDVLPDGNITNGRIFIELPSKAHNPDGMKLDELGNVYATGLAGVSIINPEGRILGQILVPEIPANLTFGGKDRRTLYITARTSIYRIELKVAGIAPLTGW